MLAWALPTYLAPIQVTAVHRAAERERQGLPALRVLPVWAVRPVAWEEAPVDRHRAGDPEAATRARLTPLPIAA